MSETQQTNGMDFSAYTVPANQVNGVAPQGAPTTMGQPPVNFSQGGALPNQTPALAPAVVNPAIPTPPPAPVTASLAPEESERIARLEAMLNEERDQRAQSEARAKQQALLDKYKLPDNIGEHFDDESLNVSRSIALNALASDDGREIVRSVINAIVPEIIEVLAPQQQTQQQNPQDPALESYLLTHLGMPIHTVRMLPGYNSFLQQPMYDGRNVGQHLKDHVENNNLAQVVQTLKPLVDHHNATAGPAPMPQMSQAPGTVAAPANWNPNMPGQEQPADPATAVFSREKLQPLLDKAQRHGFSSLTEEELKVLEAADAARYENRVT